jgi:hypothetical protein
MAKIYETEKDKQRDGAAVGVTIGSAIQGAGLQVTLFSAIAAALGFIVERFVPKDAKTLFGGSQREGLKQTNFVMMGMTLAGIASATGGYFVKKRSQATIDKLGPQEIIQPEEAQNYIQTRADHAARIAAKQETSQTPSR